MSNAKKGIWHTIVHFFAYIAHPCNYIIFVHPCLIGTYSRYCVPDMNYGLPVIGVSNIGTTVGAMKYEQSLTKLLHLLRSSIPVTFSPPLSSLSLPSVSVLLSISVYIYLCRVFSILPSISVYLSLSCSISRSYIYLSIYCICIYLLSLSICPTVTLYFPSVSCFNVQLSHSLLSICLILYCPYVSCFTVHLSPSLLSLLSFCQSVPL